ncbi:isochorismatase family protein [Arthrobacter sp. NPDC080031]|uniref:isochorismatase family protein n=1 Tax=Arthrobacter sp. NPDC080031 TaxID=3155918 RepID=UPI00344BB14D
MDTLSPSTTALLIIDMLPFIVRLDTSPRDGRTVLGACVQVANACRREGAMVVLVEPGGSARAEQLTDSSVPPIPVGPDDRTWPEALGPREGDVVVAKPRWGAFHETHLDNNLRGRGIDTVLICGIATDFGVEATVRQAYDLGFNVVVVEDATAAFTSEAHEAACRHRLPVLARIRTADHVAEALGRGRKHATTRMNAPT